MLCIVIPRFYDRPGVLWRVFSVTSEVWFSIFAFLSQVSHQFIMNEKNHVSLLPSEVICFWKGAVWFFFVFFSCYRYHFCWLIWGLKLATAFCLPTDLLQYYLNNSPASCTTSKEKFSELLRVYNSINFKGVIIVREGWKCHHFNSRSYWTPSFLLESMMKHISW